MVHIVINPSLSAAIAYNLFLIRQNVQKLVRFSDKLAVDFYGTKIVNIIFFKYGSMYCEKRGCTLIQRKSSFSVHNR